MSLQSRIRYQRLLREAEGYLELSLPHLAVAALAKIDDTSTLRSEHLYLLGEAYRALGRFVEAIDALQASAERRRS